MKPKAKKHDHRGSMWLIAGGNLCWCYQCGAWGYNLPKSQRPAGPAWYRPTGIGGHNPAVSKGEAA